MPVDRILVANASIRPEKRYRFAYMRYSPVNVKQAYTVSVYGAASTAGAGGKA